MRARDCMHWLAKMARVGATSIERDDDGMFRVVIHEATVVQWGGRGRTLANAIENVCTDNGAFFVEQDECALRAIRITDVP